MNNYQTFVLRWIRQISSSNYTVEQKGRLYKQMIRCSDITHTCEKMLRFNV